MLKNFRFISVGMLLAICLGTLFAPTAMSQNFERVPIILLAQEVLPKDLLMGPNYRIKDAVINDGLVNTYEVNTSYGSLRVESTALLLKRIAELRALTKIEALKGTDVYLKAFAQAGTAPLKTAEGLIVNPVGTVEGIGTGIGRFFSSLSSSITRSSPYKDDVLNSLLGQSSYKRVFAHQLGVDPYSPYEPLQKVLNDLSWTATAGGLTVKTALSAIPGGVAAAASYASTAGSLKVLAKEKPPNELTKINQSKLWDMGVPDPIVQAFLFNASFDPYEQTLLVGELANMTGVKDRKFFIERAIVANDEFTAVFLRVRAQMIGRYHEKTNSVARLVNAGGFPFMVTKSGVIVGSFPLDHLAWTQGFAEKEGAISSAISGMPGITGKEFWITGTVDPVARQALEKKGWKLKEKVEGRLLKM